MSLNREVKTVSSKNSSGFFKSIPSLEDMILDEHFLQVNELAGKNPDLFEFIQEKLITRLINLFNKIENCHARIQKFFKLKKRMPHRLSGKLNQYLIDAKDLFFANPFLLIKGRQDIVNHLCKLVLLGKPAEFDEIIGLHPDLQPLIFQKGVANDLTPRTIIGSPYQCMLGARDYFPDMLDIMKKCIDQVDNGRKLAAQQLCEQFPDESPNFPELKLSSFEVKNESKDAKPYFKNITNVLSREKCIGQKGRCFHLLRREPFEIDELKKEDNEHKLMQAIPENSFIYVKDDSSAYFIFVNKRKKEFVKIKAREISDFESEMQPSRIPTMLSENDLEKVKNYFCGLFKYSKILISAETEQMLEEFRDKFKIKGSVTKGHHFDIQVLIDADKVYDDEYWGILEFPAQKALYWVLVTGYLKRFLTVNLMQAFCTGLNLPDGLPTRDLQIDSKYSFPNILSQPDAGLGFEGAVFSVNSVGFVDGPMRAHFFDTLSIIQTLLDQYFTDFKNWLRESRPEQIASSIF